VWEDSCANGVDPADGQDDDCSSAGAVYLFERDTSSGAWTQTTYIKASNSEEDDEFGASVSLSGDHLVVGASGEGSCADGVAPVDGQTDNACPGSGSVYLFERDAASDTWTQSLYLKAPNSEATDAFGASISWSDDHLAVGALFEDSCADGVDAAGGLTDNICSNAGAVYTYRLAP
jgi:hypothetical protein